MQSSLKSKKMKALEPEWQRLKVKEVSEENTQTKNGLEERKRTLMGFVDGSLSSWVCM